MASDLAFLNPNITDFRADTLHKAIMKLHRLNASCHTSPDDWADNLMEATRDLPEDDQEQFIHYLSNPAGYERKVELWDALEEFDKKHTDERVWKDVQPDPYNEDRFYEESMVSGHTKYIVIKPKTELAILEEKEDDDEKRDPDLNKINFTIDCEEEKTTF